VVSFKSPADTPAMPAMSGMLRKSAAFAPRYRKFESISLQRRESGELSVPKQRNAATSRRDRAQPAISDRAEAHSRRRSQSSSSVACLAPPCRPFLTARASPLGYRHWPRPARPGKLFSRFACQIRGRAGLTPGEPHAYLPNCPWRIAADQIDGARDRAGAVEPPL
jgi:hypothetical protein